MAYGLDRFRSEHEFKVGLFLVIITLLAAAAGYPEVRYSVAGLQEIHGRITEVDTRRHRFEGYALEVSLATDKGVMLLEQRAAGNFANALAVGQPVRAWVGAPYDGGVRGPVYPVWQIERGGTVVMPALAVGDGVLDGYFKLCGALLIPLLGGLFFVARHFMRHPPDAGAGS